MQSDGSQTSAIDTKTMIMMDIIEMSQCPEALQVIGVFVPAEVGGLAASRCVQIMSVISTWQMRENSTLLCPQDRHEFCFDACPFCQLLEKGCDESPNLAMSACSPRLCGYLSNHLADRNDGAFSESDRLLPWVRWLHVLMQEGASGLLQTYQDADLNHSVEAAADHLQEEAD